MGLDLLILCQHNGMSFSSCYIVLLNLDPCLSLRLHNVVQIYGGLTVDDHLNLANNVIFMQHSGPDSSHKKMWIHLM